MRGAFRGMFRFGCSSAYSTHGYSVLQPKAGPTGTDNVEFRSYLYQLISQAAAPEQKNESKISSTIGEIFRQIKIGPEAFDVVSVGVAFMLLAGIGIGGCYLLGWIVDCQARQARLQYAQEYATMHPNVVRELQPRLAVQYGIPQPAAYSPAFGVPAAQAAEPYRQHNASQRHGIVAGAPVYFTYASTPVTPANGNVQSQQTYMYWR